MPRRQNAKYRQRSGLRQNEQGKTMVEYSAQPRVVLAILLACFITFVGETYSAAAQEKLDLYEPPNPTLIRPSEDPGRKPNGLSLTPPMGWNSWNKFGCHIDEGQVRS